MKPNNENVIEEIELRELFEVLNYELEDYGLTPSQSDNICYLLSGKISKFLNKNYTPKRSKTFKHGDVEYTLYEDGRLWSHKSEKYMTPWMMQGYPAVSLSKGSTKTYKVGLHRLLATHFIENPHNKEYVNHKNGDTTDYRLENLEWVTNSENHKHARENGLNYGSVKYFVERDGKKIPAVRVAKENGIKRELLYSRIKDGWDIDRAVTVRPRGIYTETEVQKKCEEYLDGFVVEHIIPLLQVKGVDVSEAHSKEIKVLVIDILKFATNYKTQKREEVEG